MYSLLMILSFIALVFFFYRFFPSFIISLMLLCCYVRKKGVITKVKHSFFQYSKKCLINFICCFILILISHQLENRTNIENLIAQVENWRLSLFYHIDSKAIIDPFNYQYAITKNEETVYTEKIVNSSLYFEEGTSIIEKYSGIDRIDEYNSLVEGLIPTYDATPEISLITFGKTEDYKYFKGDRLRSVDTISAEINSYNAPTDVPVATYIEEFYARAKAYSQEHTGENAYQTARSADDIINGLYNDADAVEECTYFGNYCIQYYLESLKYDIPNETKCDIFLKISKVIQNLCLRSELGEYKTHFLLLSNGFLALAQFYDENIDNLCFEQFEYYYGTSLYNVGKKCKINDQEYFKTCKTFLEKYLTKETQNETYSKSCNDLIDRIKKEYPSLNEDTTIQ